MNLRALFQTKYIPLWMYLLALIMLIASFINVGSGWGVGAIAFAIIATIWLLITRFNTGQWFTDSSGGK